MHITATFIIISNGPLCYLRLRPPVEYSHPLYELVRHLSTAPLQVSNIKPNNSALDHAV